MSITALNAKHQDELRQIENQLRARYGVRPPRAAADWNDHLSLLLNHKSVRAYLPDALPSGTIETLAAAAQSAASSSNLQLWSVVAVQDEGRKGRLADLAGGQKHIRQAPLLLVWLADLSRAAALAEAQGFAPETLDYLETAVVGIVDAALAAQNAVVAAESLGLGTVYIGALRNQPEKVAAELNLPKHILPVFGLVIGHPDPDAPAGVKPRLPQSVVLHHETYAARLTADDIAAYDEVLSDFQRDQKVDVTGWSATLANRIKSPQSLNGRERLSEALHNLGFKLK